MAKSVLYMSMSLDGFVTGPGDGLGIGGLRPAAGSTTCPMPQPDGTEMEER